MLTPVDPRDQVVTESNRVFYSPSSRWRDYIHGNYPFTVTMLTIQKLISRHPISGREDVFHMYSINSIPRSLASNANVY